MSFKNAPVEITSLRDIIADADAWAGYSQLRIDWAEAIDDDFPGTGPIALLSLMGERKGRIVILSDGKMTEGEIHRLAQDLAFQIQTRYRIDGTGLHIPKEPTVSIIGVPSEWMKTAGNDASAVMIDFVYGISTD